MREPYIVFSFTEYGNIEAGMWTESLEDAKKEKEYRVKITPDASSEEIIIAKILEHVNSSGEEVDS